MGQAFSKETDRCVFVVTRSEVVFMSEMTLIALVTALPSVGAAFVGWLLAGYWAVLNRALLVTVEWPGLDTGTVQAW